MTLSDLTLRQLLRLLNRAKSDLRYYALLKERMYRKRLLGDELTQVERVHAGLQHWRMTLHYEVVSRRRQEEGWTQ